MITEIIFNWYATTEHGEEFSKYAVGTGYLGVVCEKIEEHRPMGDGDKWYYDVYLSNGTIERIFNPNTVTREKEKN